MRHVLACVLSALVLPAAGAPARPVAALVHVAASGPGCVHGWGTLPGSRQPSADEPRSAGFFADPALQDKGGGGWQLWSDGTVDAIPYGVTPFFGDLPDMGVRVGNIVSMLADPSGTGYYLLGADGGVFSFCLPWHGSVPGLGPLPPPHYPAIGMSWCGPDVTPAETPSGYVVQVDSGWVSPGEYYPFNCS